MFLSNLKKEISKKESLSIIKKEEHIIVSFNLRKSNLLISDKVFLEIKEASKLLMSKYNFRFCYIAGFNISFVIEAQYSKEHIFNGNPIRIISNLTSYFTMLINQIDILKSSYFSSTIYSSEEEDFLLDYFLYRSVHLKTYMSRQDNFESISPHLKYGCSLKKTERLDKHVFKFKDKVGTIEKSSKNLNYILDDFLDLSHFDDF